MYAYFDRPIASCHFSGHRQKEMRKRNHSIDTDNLTTALSSSYEFLSQTKRSSLVDELRVSPGSVITSRANAGTLYKIVPKDSASLQKKLFACAKLREHNEFLVHLQSSLSLQDSTTLFVFRKYEYGSLFDVLRRNKSCPFHPHQLLKIAFSLATAMDFLHSQELTHGFLTAAHCVLDEYGFIRLCGLNNLHQGTSANTSRWSDYTNIEYLAPEAAKGHHSGSVDPFLVDMFAIGIILHHCLYGKLPSARSDDAFRMDEVIFASTKSALRPILLPTTTGTNSKVGEAKFLVLEAQNTIYRLTNANPSVRPRAGALLHLNWLRDAAPHCLNDFISMNALIFN